MEHHDAGEGPYNTTNGEHYRYYDSCERCRRSDYLPCERCRWKLGNYSTTVQDREATEKRGALVQNGKRQSRPHGMLDQRILFARRRRLADRARSAAVEVVQQASTSIVFRGCPAGQRGRSRQIRSTCISGVFLLYTQAMMRQPPRDQVLTTEKNYNEIRKVTSITYTSYSFPPTHKAQLMIILCTKEKWTKQPV